MSNKTIVSIRTSYLQQPVKSVIETPYVKNMIKRWNHYVINNNQFNPININKSTKNNLLKEEFIEQLAWIEAALNSNCSLQPDLSINENTKNTNKYVGTYSLDETNSSHLMNSYFYLDVFSEFSGRECILVHNPNDDLCFKQINETAKFLFNTYNAIWIKATIPKKLNVKITKEMFNGNIHNINLDIYSQLVYTMQSGTDFIMLESIPMSNEVRIFTINKKIITLSKNIPNYVPVNLNTGEYYNDKISQDKLNFAKSIISNIPDEISHDLMTVDICDTKNKYALVELNPGRNAGLYHCNPQKILNAIK